MISSKMPRSSINSAAGGHMTSAVSRAFGCCCRNRRSIANDSTVSPIPPKHMTNPFCCLRGFRDLAIICSFFTIARFSTEMQPTITSCVNISSQFAEVKLEIRTFSMYFIACYLCHDYVVRVTRPCHLKQPMLPLHCPMLLLHSPPHCPCHGHPLTCHSIALAGDAKSWPA